MNTYGKALDLAVLRFFFIFKYAVSKYTHNLIHIFSTALVSNHTLFTHVGVCDSARGVHITAHCKWDVSQFKSEIEFFKNISNQIVLQYKLFRIFLLQNSVLYFQIDKILRYVRFTCRCPYIFIGYIRITGGSQMWANRTNKNPN